MNPFPMQNPWDGGGRGIPRDGGARVSPEHESTVETGREGRGEPVRMGDGGARDGATAGEPGTGDHGGARE